VVSVLEDSDSSAFARFTDRPWVVNDHQTGRSISLFVADRIKSLALDDGLGWVFGKPTVGLRLLAEQESRAFRRDDFPHVAAEFAEAWGHRIEFNSFLEAVLRLPSNNFRRAAKGDKSAPVVCHPMPTRNAKNPPGVWFGWSGETGMTHFSLGSQSGGPAADERPGAVVQPNTSPAIRLALERPGRDRWSSYCPLPASSSRPSGEAD
jgi:hypothetical protein